MKSVNEALFSFWSGFGVPAFLDRVPQGQTFPYITFEVIQGDALTSLPLTAFNWHKERPGVSLNAERSALMDAIADAIPPEGRRLPLNGGGFLVIQRNGAQFQSYYDDPEDENVRGGRTSYEVRYYTT